MKESQFSRILTIFFKEVRETMRDKRVLIGVIISPLLVIPLLLGAIGYFSAMKMQSRETEILVVGIYEQSNIPDIKEIIQKNDTLKLEIYKDQESSELAITDRVARAILVVPEDAAEEIAAGNQSTLEILYDNSNEKSQTAIYRLAQLIKELDKEIVIKRLAKEGLDESILKPTSVENRSLASNESESGLIIGLILPYIVILGTAMGGMTTAFDLCAGEKERGTMETLLVSPASRYDIIVGKLMATSVVSALSTICSITGIVITFLLGDQVMSEMLNRSFSISPFSIFIIILIATPLGLFTSSMQIMISSFARNQKEAQTYSFPFIIGVMMIALLSFTIEAESPLYIACIPLLNTAIVMKQALTNILDLQFFCLSLATSLIYALVSMRLTVMLFQRENIIFRH